MSLLEKAMWINVNNKFLNESRYTFPEKIDFIKSFDQLRKAPAFNRIPTIILTSDKPFKFNFSIAQEILPSSSQVDLGMVIFEAHLKAQKTLSELLKAKHVTNTLSRKWSTW